jgi:hypothetical protein
MKIPGLPSSLTGVVPGGGTAVDDSGTPLQIARFVTRWDYQGDAYYVEATLDGTEGGISYGAGKVSTDEGVFNANPTATLGNTYAPLVGATGAHKAGEIVVKVPASAVGGVGVGKNVYSVGSYALIGHDDVGVGVLQNLPITVDSTPTFDTAMPLIKATAGTAQGNGAVVGVAPEQASAPAVKPAASAAAAPAQQPVTAPAEDTTDSSGFSRTAAISTGGLGLLALLTAGALVYRRRTKPVPAPIPPSTPDTDA